MVSVLSIILGGFFAIGLVVGILTLCVVKPEIGRVLARGFAVLAIGPGVGFLIWGGIEFARGAAANVSPGIPIAVGAGFFTSGALALVLSFSGTSKTNQSQ